MQPSAMVLDANDKLWVLTDGGGDNSPSLYRIDARARTVEKRFRFNEGDLPRDLQLDGAGRTLYFINNSVWRMPVTAESLPDEPFLEYNRTIYYALTVNPVNGDVYVADAIDYQQPGRVYRFSSDGRQIDSFAVGIIPGSFCWL
jgi:hypothetical protein